MDLAEAYLSYGQKNITRSVTYDGRRKVSDGLCLHTHYGSVFEGPLFVLCHKVVGEHPPENTSEAHKIGLDSLRISSVHWRLFYIGPVSSAASVWPGWGFDYTAANVNKGAHWDESTLFEYLETSKIHPWYKNGLCWLEGAKGEKWPHHLPQGGRELSNIFQFVSMLIVSCLTDFKVWLRYFPGKFCGSILIHDSFNTAPTLSSVKYLLDARITCNNLFTQLYEGDTHRGIYHSRLGEKNDVTLNITPTHRFLPFC